MDENIYEPQDALDEQMSDTDLEVYSDFFVNQQRKNPGTDKLTEGIIRDLFKMEDEGSRIQIADVGCGIGHNSMFIAGLLPNCFIKGFDMLEAEIDIYNRTVSAYGFSNRCEGICTDLDQLPLEKESLDLIWAEGSISSVGFEEGLSSWKEYLKPGGCIYLTDTVWVREEERPVDMEWVEFTQPDICTIKQKVEWMERLGYEVIRASELPAEATMNHYGSLFNYLPVFHNKHRGNKTAEMLYESMRYEIQFYDRYSYLWNHAMFLARKKA